VTGPEGTKRWGGGAALVAVGIFLSRIMGLLRQRALSHFLGTGPAADAFSAALRIPNFLQNLFGEGVLSASFIPVYARLLAKGDEKEAGKVAGAIGALLALTASVLVLLGVLLTPVLITLIAPGFSGDKRELTIRLVQVMFPGVGILVLSAWCLGVLNSHRRFFLSYVSPVAWNLVIIGAVLGFGNRVGEARLAEIAAWASVAGSAMQLLVQLPTVLRLDRHLRATLDTRDSHVRTVLVNFAPVFVGRGVVQISGYVDQLLASLVVDGAVTVLFIAQNVSMLPVSLFGMAISAAELPAMSSVHGTDDEIAVALRARLGPALRRIAFLIVPSAMAFMALGDVIAAGIYQTGQFTRSDAVWVWSVLGGSAVGLLATTMGRLYSSAWYALRDTMTPLKFALVRVTLTLGLGYVAAILVPRWMGLNPRWGVAGLTASAGVAGWVEFALLRSRLHARIGVVELPGALIAALWGAAGLAAAVAWGVKLAVGVEHPLVLAALALPVYGAVYFGVTPLLGVPESREVLSRLRRALTGRTG
jgi:putative peptidoglycan lipid II flippase